jgi:hypothetical protein
MGDYEYQTPTEAADRIARGNKLAALAWVEQVGSYPSSDPEIREVTQRANRLLGFPDPASAPEC